MHAHDSLMTRNPALIAGSRSSKRRRPDLELRAGYGAAVLKVTLAALVTLATAACGGADMPAETAPEEAADTPAAAEAPAADAAPRLVWLTPQDGAEVTSPVHLMFSAQNYQIAAVPEGTVEAARPGIAHHHVGVDTECLPAGTEIPKANPWVHFGDGSNMMNMQFEPGEHTLTLQAGDDLHRAVEGLCETITVTVVE